jgi:hypothetical protein
MTWARLWRADLGTHASGVLLFQICTLEACVPSGAR